MKTNYGPFSILVDQGHYEKRGEHGKAWVVDPPKRTSVTVAIDVIELSRVLGRRASRSKSGKATGLHGLVVVTEAR